MGVSYPTLTLRGNRNKLFAMNSLRNSASFHEAGAASGMQTQGLLNGFFIA